MKRFSLFLVVTLLLSIGVTPFIASGQAAQVWIPSNSRLQLFNASYGVRIQSLTNCDSIDTNSQGVLACGTDSGGSGSISTTTALADTQVVYATGASTIGSEAAFTYNATTNVLTAANAVFGTQLTVTPLTSALTLTNGSGVLAEYTGTTCTNQFVRVLSALGVATCATVGTADVSGLDISDDTNLAGDTEIVLTGDALSIASTIARDSELHSAVTLSGALDYITLVGQDIVRGAIDLATDVTGALGIANGGLGAAFTDPNADQIMFWDDTAAKITGLTSLVGATISGTTLTVDDVTCTGCLGSTEIAGLDISADTNLTAGRSLTLTGDDVLADAELYTDSKTIYFESPTAADDFKTLWVAPTAVTITSISCESDQTVNFDLQVDDGTATGVNGSDIACTTFATDSSLAGDTTLASGDRVDLALTSVSGTPTWVSITFAYTKDD